MAVLSLSRQFGAGGKTLGRRLAGRLGYQFVYRDILNKIAEEAKVSLGWVEAVEREAGGRLMRILDGLISSEFIERHVGGEGADFDETKYVAFLSKVIQKAAEQGDVVIVGRGSQFILSDHPQTVRVLLVAAMDFRVRFLVDHYEMDQTKAMRWIQEEEHRRTRFLRLLSEASPDDPKLYHLCINTGLVDLGEAEEIIMSLMGSLVDREARPIWD